jgi:hypothetical protein
MLKIAALLIASSSLFPLVNAADNNSHLVEVENITNLQYPVLLEEENMQQWLDMNQDLIKSMQLIVDARASYSNKLLEKANGSYMLEQYASRFSNGVKVVNNPTKMHINAENKVELENMVSCRALQPLFKRFSAQPEQISGIDFTHIEYLWKSCNTVQAIDSLRYKKPHKNQDLSAQSWLYIDTFDAEVTTAMAREPEFIQSLRNYGAKLSNLFVKAHKSSYAPNPEIYTAEYIKKLAAEEYARVTGSTLADGPAVYAAMQSEKQSKLKAALAKASTQALPQAPFSFDANEENIIRANLKKKKWKCDALRQETTGGDFVSKLYICGIVATDPELKSFANSYFLAYQKR